MTLTGACGPDGLLVERACFPWASTSRPTSAWVVRACPSPAPRGRSRPPPFSTTEAYSPGHHIADHAFDIVEQPAQTPLHGTAAPVRHHGFRVDGAAEAVSPELVVVEGRILLGGEHVEHAQPQCQRPDCLCTDGHHRFPDRVYLAGPLVEARVRERQDARRQGLVLLDEVGDLADETSSSSAILITESAAPAGPAGMPINNE